MRAGFFRGCLWKF